MKDLIESHAYHFRKEVGYDLFRRCEDLHARSCRSAGRQPVEGTGAQDRRGRVLGVRPPPAAGDAMPEENRKFYREILTLHEEQKNLDELNTTLSSVREFTAADESFESVSTDAAVPSAMRTSRRRRHELGDGNNSETDRCVDFVDELPQRRKRCLSHPNPVPVPDKEAAAEETAASPATDLLVCMEQAASALPVSSEGEVLAQETVPLPLDTDSTALIVLDTVDESLLMQSITLSSSPDTRPLLIRWSELLVAGTEGWDADRLAELMAAVTAVSKDFQRHWDWPLLMQELNVLVQGVQGVPSCGR